MSREEARSAINALLDTAPDAVVEEVLALLQSATDKSNDAIALSQNLRKILEEDRGLLQRLAQ